MPCATGHEAEVWKNRINYWKKKNLTNKKTAQTGSYAQETFSSNFPKGRFVPQEHLASNTACSTAIVQTYPLPLFLPEEISPLVTFTRSFSQCKDNLGKERAIFTEC